MTLEKQNFRGDIVGVSIADTLEGLNAISEPGCAAAIWRRQAKRGFADWVNAIDPVSLPTARAVLPADDVGKTLSDLFNAENIRENEYRRWIENDVLGLAQTFSGIMNAPFLRVRFDAVSTNACRRFHVDAIKSRLICTYRGSGTQYGISHTRDAPRRVFQTATGSPMILRGSLWPPTPAAGLLHRSPPIEGSGETRWVVVIDPVYDLENA